MRHINTFSELNDDKLDELSDCLQEIFDKYEIPQGSSSGYFYIGIKIDYNS